MDLSTRYLGLTLRSPLVASAGPLTGSLAGISELAEAGVGAVVLPSLFEEQLRAEADRDWYPAAAYSEGAEPTRAHFRQPGDPGGRPETFTVSKGFRLSDPAEAALPRAWISRLHGLVRCSLAASTGVDSSADVAAYNRAGYLSAVEQATHAHSR